MEGTERELNVFFWHNIRDAGGLRLTEGGHNYLSKNLQLETYEVDIREQRVNNKFLVELDKYLTCPYYMKTGRKTLLNGGYTSIILYDEKTYFWLVMNNKEWDRFLRANKA